MPSVDETPFHDFNAGFPVEYTSEGRYHTLVQRHTNMYGAYYTAYVAVPISHKLSKMDYWELNDWVHSFVQSKRMEDSADTFDYIPEFTFDMRRESEGFCIFGFDTAPLDPPFEEIKEVTSKTKDFLRSVEE